MMTHPILIIALLVLALLGIEVAGTPGTPGASPARAQFLSPNGILLPHPSVPMEYSGIINGVPVTAKGSLQEIYAQIGLPDSMESYVDDANEANATLVERGDMSDCNCVPVLGNEQWKGAWVESLEKIINYWRGWNGKCTIKAAKCSRMACLHGSGVHICNDRSEDYHLPCNEFAAYPQKIVDKCLKKGTFWRGDSVGGQIWNTAGWNMFVINEGCR